MVRKKRGLLSIKSFLVIFPLIVIIVGVIVANILVREKQDVRSHAADCNYPSVSFSGGGFASNEPVSTWVSLSDNQTFGTPQTKADSSGYVSVSIKGQGSWPTGIVRVVAHGQRSNNEGFEDQTYYAPPCASSVTCEYKTFTVSVDRRDNSFFVNISPVPVGIYDLPWEYDFNPWNWEKNQKISVWVKFANGITKALPSGKTDSQRNFRYTFNTKGWPQVSRGSDIMNEIVFKSKPNKTTWKFYSTDFSSIGCN